MYFLTTVQTDIRISLDSGIHFSEKKFFFPVTSSYIQAEKIHIQIIINAHE